jgi:hypothetical protein
MNDDNGLAALGAALVRADYLSPNGYPTTDSFAAAILRNGAVFLPEGLGPVMVGMAKEIAALRAAPLDVRMVVQAINAVAKRHRVAKDPPERPLMHIFGYTSATPDMDAEIAAEYAALTAVKETP